MKLATRAGLGPCQGRTCGRAVEAIVAEAGGAPGGAPEGFDRRPVLAPVRLGEVAALAPVGPAGSTVAATGPEQ